MFSFVFFCFLFFSFLVLFSFLFFSFLFFSFLFFSFVIFFFLYCLLFLCLYLPSFVCKRSSCQRFGKPILFFSFFVLIFALFCLGQIVEIKEGEEEEDDTPFAEQLKMQEIMAQIEGRYEEARKERIIKNLQANLKNEVQEEEEPEEDEITIFVHPSGQRRLVANQEDVDEASDL